MHHSLPLCEYDYCTPVASLIRSKNLTLCSPQNDSSSQEFYARTVAALDKKEASDADVARKLQEVKDAAKNQEPVAGAGLQKPLADPGKKDGGYVDVNVPEKGSSAKDTSHKAPSDKRPLEKEGEERSVAGRKTIKGGELKGPHSNKEVHMGAGKEGSRKEKTKGPKGVEGKDAGDAEESKEAEEPPESKEEHELEVELNSILKKGPSECSPRISQLAVQHNVNTRVRSNHLLQILLPLLCQGKAYPS